MIRKTVKIIPFQASFFKGITQRVIWLVVALYACLGAYGQQLVVPVYSDSLKQTCVVAIDHIEMLSHDSEEVTLQMSFSLVGADVPSRDIVWVTPRLVSETDSVYFPSIAYYGNWSYLHVVRSGEEDDAEDLHYRAKDGGEKRLYARTVAYQPWMRKGKLEFLVSEADACGNEKFLEVRPFSESAFFAPKERVVITHLPDTIVEMAGEIRQLQGTSYISFPVNNTTIYIDHGRNREELGAIRNTLDSVLQRNMLLLHHITLKGFASPEGSYTNNERLARGRVHSLRDFLVSDMGIPEDRISVDYEPEDWAGLRRYVEDSQMPERASLLSIIDSDRDPDVKLARIQALYPATYKNLLKDVFPLLRHTDYRIDYFIQDPSRVVKVSRGGTQTEGKADTIVVNDLQMVAKPEPTRSNFNTYRPFLAVKTNLLFDCVLAPNIEVEMPFGRDYRWSVMAECWFPWYRFEYNSKGKDNVNYRSDQRPTKTSYELLMIGAELRYWFAPRCQASRPALSGAFFGFYMAGGKYDLGRKGKGDQGEFTSLGYTIGYSWPIGRKWNLELSGSIGYVGGPQVHYQNEFDDARLIYRSDTHMNYFGPTKAKVSLVWIIGKK